MAFILLAKQRFSFLSDDLNKPIFMSEVYKYTELGYLNSTILHIYVNKPRIRMRKS